MNRLIQVENITYNFGRYNPQFDEIPLGDAELGIPSNMLKRFIRECGYEGVLPHYNDWDMETLDKHSEHCCTNPDTQIVLMNWLHDKQRKYKLDYNGTDPFWIYHDYCHSQGDVYSFEVNNITAHVEAYRLREGAEMSAHYGHKIKAKTLVDIDKAWYPRWKNAYGGYTDFNPYSFTDVMSSKEAEKLDMLMPF